MAQLPPFPGTTGRREKGFSAVIAGWWVWAVAAALYIGFRLFYDNWRGRLTPEEIETMLAGGIPAERIDVLVATGLHRPNLGAELEELVGDPWVLETVRVTNHVARDIESLIDLGVTATRGTPVHINRVLMGLRSRALITLRSRTLVIEAWEELMEVAEFDPRYLHLDRRAA